jgi:predicted metalloprotease
VKYYDYYNSYGQLVDFSTPCNSTAGYHGSQGFYCTTNQTIYIDYNQQRDNIRTYGDGAVALWLDHEFGHHVQYLSRFSANAPYVELNADCIAGITFRSEITRTGNLNSGDYTEARNNIYRAGGDGAHGTGTQRLNAFDYGYNDFGWPDCNRYW